MIASLDMVLRKSLRGTGFPNSVSIEFSRVLFWGVMCPREPISIAKYFTVNPLDSRSMMRWAYLDSL